MRLILLLHLNVDVIAAKIDSLKTDSLLKVKNQQAVTGFKFDTTNKEVLTVLENEVLKITFTNKGAQPKFVELKNFKTFDNKPLMLQSGNFNKMDMNLL